MKSYKILTIYSDGKYTRRTTIKYANGLSAARTLCPVKLHYSNNMKAFCGIDLERGIDCIVTEAKRRF